MYLTGCVLLALIATVLSAPSGGKHLSIGLNVHKKLDSLEQFQEHLSSLRAHKGPTDIPLKEFADMLYYTEVGLGTPGQKVNVLVDTTTADLLVPSSQMCKKQTEFCKNHKTYNERKSKTYKKVGKKWKSDDALYVASGYTSNDTVQVGGLQVKSQTFGEATQLYILIGAPFDGILGLAFNSVRKIDSNSVFANMIEQKVVDQPVFAFYLNKYGQTTGAELVLGGVDSSHYTGEFTYTPVTKQSNWFIDIQGLTMKSEKIVGQYPASLDVNSGIFYGPAEFTDKINEALNGEKQWDGSYTVDCSKISSFPDITFTISGKPFVFTPSEYTMKWNSGKEVVCYSQFCGFKDLKYFILGETFISKYYTVFDMGKNRVGFATAK